jgi:hypothetical protein
MEKVGKMVYPRSSIMKLLDISPEIRSRLLEYGDMGENAFDVYTLYKSAAKRRLTDIIETNDALDMQCLAWMTREDFLNARKLLRTLGYITEMVDREEDRKPVVRRVRLREHLGPGTDPGVSPRSVTFAKTQ